MGLDRRRAAREDRGGREGRMKIIHDDPPMREEIAASFYPAFETVWRRTELAGRGLLLAFLVACVLGVFGHGLFSRRTRTNDDDTIRISYDAVVRYGAPTSISFDTKVPPGGDKVAVTMAKDLVDLFGLESITPHPSRWEAGQEGIRLEFPVIEKSRRVAIRFSGSPSFRGSLHLWARLDKGEQLSWSQYSVP